MPKPNYQATKTSDLVALATARDIAVTSVDGKADRKELIAHLKRDDAEQAAMAEDMATVEERDDQGRTADERAAEEKAGGGSAPGVRHPGETPPKSSAAPSRELPAIGAAVHVQFPDGRVEPAVVMGHQGGDLLELVCTGRNRRGALAPYQRSRCPAWVDGATLPGWK